MKGFWGLGGYDYIRSLGRFFGGGFLGICFVVCFLFLEGDVFIFGYFFYVLVFSGNMSVCFVVFSFFSELVCRRGFWFFRFGVFYFV